MDFRQFTSIHVDSIFNGSGIWGGETTSHVMSHDNVNSSLLLRAIGAQGAA